MKAISSVRKSALCGALDGGRSLIKDVSAPKKALKLPDGVSQNAKLHARPTRYRLRRIVGVGF
jgi:hypothetical protein